MIQQPHVARAILNLRVQYLSVLIASQLAVDPRLPLLSGWRAAFPEAPNPVLELPGPASEVVQVPLSQILEDVSGLGWEPMHSVLLTAQHLTGAALGERVRAADVSTEERHGPLFQFVRHYRNGCAHNGRWSIDANRYRPGSFGGIDVELSDHGRAVTDKVTPYVHVRLIETVAACFGPPAPTDRRAGWRARETGWLVGQPRPTYARINEFPPRKE